MEGEKGEEPPRSSAAMPPGQGAAGPGWTRPVRVRAEGGQAGQGGPVTSDGFVLNGAGL